MIDELVALHKVGEAVFPVDLDDIAQVIGLRAVSYEEVELIVDALEAEGLTVGEELRLADVDALRRLIGAARGLRDSLGRPPTSAELAAKTGLPAGTVAVMLRRARRAR